MNSNGAKSVSLSASKKSRTFFTFQMDLHLIRLCVEHNPYQLGKNQWNDILANMNENFEGGFLLRTVKERASSLVEKYKKECLKYKTGTEEEITELANLLEILVGYIDASSIPIVQQINAAEEESGNVQRPSRNSQKNEKIIADMERDELLLCQSDDSAPGPKMSRKKRNNLHPEDELIRQKQEQDYELEVKRLKLEERKLEIDYDLQQQKIALEREKLSLEREKIHIAEEENKRRDLIYKSQITLQQQMHDLVVALAKK